MSVRKRTVNIHFRTLPCRIFQICEFFSLVQEHGIEFAKIIIDTCEIIAKNKI